MNGRTCPTCKKKLYPISTSSINLDASEEKWIYDYDTRECWINSAEYMQAIISLNAFLNSLTKKQMEHFKFIFNLSSDYENIINRMLETRLTKTVK